MDSEEEEPDDALAALEQALDQYAAQPGAPPADGYDDGPVDGEEFVDGGAYDDGFAAAGATLPPDAAAPPYDYPGNPQSPSAPALGDSGRSFGGRAEASTASIGEEIDVTTQGLIDETVQRLSFVHGVLGVLILDKDGLVVHATMPPQEAAQLTGPTLQMLQRARAATEVVAPGDELQMLCVRTRKYEMLLCSEANGAFAVCVVQDPAPEQADAPLVFGATSGAARSLRRGGAIAPAAPGVVF